MRVSFPPFHPFFFFSSHPIKNMYRCQTGHVELWQPMKKFADGPRVVPNTFVAIKVIHKVGSVCGGGGPRVCGMLSEGWSEGVV